MMRAVLLILATLAFPSATFAITDEQLGARSSSSSPSDSALECVGNAFCACYTESNYAGEPEFLKDASGNDIGTSSACSAACTSGSWRVACLNRNDQAIVLASNASAGDTRPDISIEITKANEVTTPNLIVDIPGVDFSQGVGYDEEGNLRTNFLATYIDGIYRFLIPAMTLVAVVMLMVSGMQYILARGNADQVKKAKHRMSGAVVGLVLLLAAYNIAYIINPQFVNLQPLTIRTVEEIRLDESIQHENDTHAEGSGTSVTGTSWQELSAEYRAIVQRAKDGATCTIEGGLGSPTGKLPNQGRHHWFDRGRNGDYTKINALDWAAPWGSEILAPFDGVVTYDEQENTDNLCGNRIWLEGASGKIVICHAKDFLNANNEYAPGMVKKGDVIGHVGGICCSGERAPSGWVTQCNASGTPCTDPTSNESCSCQPIEQAGNTTGPHVHITMYSGGNILACLE